MRGLVVSIVTLLAAASASAHPDHVGGSAVDVAHYVTDPFHVAMGALGVAGMVSLVSAWRTRQRRAALLHRRP